jgi:death-on-curing protein
VGISRNHPFVDGNKRVAFISLALFLRLNGRRLAAEQVEAVRIMLALAEGMLTEGELTEWIKRHVVHAT